MLQWKWGGGGREVSWGHRWKCGGQSSDRSHWSVSTSTSPSKSRINTWTQPQVFHVLKWTHASVHHLWIIIMVVMLSVFCFYIYVLCFSEACWMEVNWMSCSHWIIKNSFPVWPFKTNYDEGPTIATISHCCCCFRNSDFSYSVFWALHKNLNYNLAINVIFCT